MTWTAFLSVVGFCFAACALAAAVLAVQALRRWQTRCDALEATVESLRREVELVASISARTGRRVQRVEHEYSEVAERVDVVESRAPSAAGTGSLDQAIEWARRGADADKLAEQFGLSSGEAELVARMHGAKTSA
jgi:phage shock protein A